MILNKCHISAWRNGSRMALKTPGSNPCWFESSRRDHTWRHLMQPNDYSFDYYYGGDILKVNDQGEVEVIFPEHYSMEEYTMSRPASTATSSSKTINPPYIEELPNLPNQYPNEAPRQDHSYGGASGWVCPKCGRVYSPFTPMCYYCGNNSYPGQIVFTCGPSSSGDAPPLASTNSPKTVSKSNL